jgi:hypothetical protein
MDTRKKNLSKQNFKITVFILLVTVLSIFLTAIFFNMALTESICDDAMMITGIYHKTNFIEGRIGTECRNQVTHQVITYETLQVLKR